MADVDLQGCETCDKQVPIANAIYMEGCYFCPECYAAWKETFDACSHTWEPHHNEMGEDGFYCTRCAGFVATEDFPSLGLIVPKAA